MHGRLMLCGVLERGVPDALHVLAAEPLLGLSAQSDDRSALIADEILCGGAHGPAEARCLRNDLIGRVHGLRSADLRNGFHLLYALEQLHAEGNGPELEHTFQFRGQLRKIRSIVHRALQLERPATAAATSNSSNPGRGRIKDRFYVGGRKAQDYTFT